MKSSHFLLSLLTVFLASLTVSAQDFAPTSFNAELMTINITNGTFLAPSGTYKLFIPAFGSSYRLFDEMGASLYKGGYAYAKTGTNTSTLSLQTATDPIISNYISAQFTFSTTNSGTILWTLGGMQSGTFTLANFSKVNSPQLFLPAVTNGHFATFVGGQRGFNYDIQSSSNGAAWALLTNISLTDLTSNFTDSVSAPSRRLYRAKIHASAFAPVSIAGQTFNFTISSGAPSLVTNGIFQFLATNSTGFQIIGGPGMANTNGVYTYSATNGDYATILYSVAGGTPITLAYTSPTTGIFSMANYLGYQTGTFSMNAGPRTFLGNVRFDTDTNRGATKLFAANGAPLTITVTNATGYIFQLSLPADALLTPRVISMTPFTNIDSSQSWLPIVAGVQLEPDGIEFADAVTLSITPPAALGSNAAVVMANDDGSALYFVASTNQNNTFSTKLAHFTSGGVTDPSPEEENALQNQYLAGARAAYQAAKAILLTTGFSQPPPPPNYDLSCNSDTPNTAVLDAETDAYVFSFFAYDDQAIQFFMNEAIALSAFGDPTGLAEAPLVISQFVETSEFFRVQSLFDTYNTDPRKFIPFARVAKAVELRDVMNQGLQFTHFDSDIAAFGMATRDFYFDKLKTAHDYSVVMPLQRLETILSGLGYPDTGDFMTMLQKALTFHITLDYKLNTSAAQEEAKGDFTLDPGPNIFPCTGSGTMNYLYGNDGDFTLLPGQSFAVNASIDNIDACFGMTISVIANSFGGSVNYSVAGVTTISQPSFLSQSAAVVFRPMLQTSGSYSGEYLFNAELQNRNATAVNDTIVGMGRTGGEVDVTIMLQHTPQ